MAERVAALRDGPAGRVLDRHWNKIHDIQDALESVAHEYDVASSYKGKPGERDALKVMQAFKETLRNLEAVSKSFDKLYKAEEAFVKKHGEPDDYADKVRSEIYPL